MFNFEKQQERMETRLLLDRAHERAQREIASAGIKPDKFRDLYGEEAVDRDLAYVADMEERFRRSETQESREAHKVATVFEGIFYDQAEMSDWLGPDAITIMPSRYDDIKNGVDTIIETRHEGGAASHFGVAIDVTSGIDLDKKFERIMDEIRAGKLSRVKYFKSDHMKFRGELSRLPRIVIGASGKTVTELAELWLEKDNKALASHPVQFQILEEMELQFSAFKAFAKKVNQPDIAAIYSQALLAIRKIIEEKKGSLKDNGDRDEVFESIKSWMKNFKDDDYHRV